MLSFSVVTCTWNSQPFIKDCIRSVAAQRDVNVEQVFVDGGSTDGTLEEIDGSPVEHRCLHDVRGGISFAMNRGLQVARNEVVVHLHGDDYFLGGDVLRRVSEIMEESGAEWVCGRIVSDVGGRMVPSSWRLPHFSRSRLLSGNFIAHPATFVRRSFFERVGGFDESLKYAMDYDMWLRMSKLADPVCREDAYTAFRRHPGSTSTANALAAFREDHVVRLKHLRNDGICPLKHQWMFLWRKWRRFGLNGYTKVVR